ncbi:MAG: hypothetical protein QXR58_00895 [Candidatus Micrarchaeaceae archaeon]
MAELLLTINMRKFLLKQAKPMRLRRAPGYVRERVAHYMKLSPESVKLSTELNSLITKYYSKSMRKLKLSVSVDNGIANVKPFERSIQTKYSARKARSFQKMHKRLFPDAKKMQNAQANTVQKVATASAPSQKGASAVSK